MSICGIQKSGESPRSYGLFWQGGRLAQQKRPIFHPHNRLLRILFLVALFRLRNLALTSLEAPPSCFGPHPKHQDLRRSARVAESLSRYNRWARASISTLGKGNRQSLVAYRVGYVFGAIKKIANDCFALHSCHAILFFSEILELCQPFSWPDGLPMIRDAVAQSR